MAPEIDFDGNTVWVNDDTGCCIGRLGRLGVDVHKTGPQQMLGGSQCLDCHSPPIEQMWDYFKNSMLAHHSVEIPEAAKPLWAIIAP